MRKAIYWTAAGAVLLGAYALVGYHFAPRWLRSAATAWVRDTWHRELTLGALHLDPFRLQLVAEGVSLPDADGRPMLGFDRLLVNFEVSSLWHRAWVFSAVQLDAPAVHAVIRADGRLNLADLQLPQAPPPPDAKPQPLPRLWLQSLTVARGSAEYTQIAGRQQPLVKRAEPINFSLRDFRTTGEDGGFVLTARTETDEQLQWRGELAVAPQLTSRGEISIAKLQLAGLADLLPETLPATLSGGLLEVRAQYQFTLADPLQLQAQIPELTVSSLTMRPRGAGDDWISLPTLRVQQVDFDLARRSLHAQSVGVAGLAVKAWRDREQQLNLLQLWSTSTPDAGPPTPPAPEPAAAPAASWNVGVADFEVSAASIDFEDRLVRGGGHIVIQPLNLSVHDASLDLSRPLPVALEATIDQSARLKVSGTLAPAPLAATLDIALQDARARMLQPYVLPVADLSILSGTISAAGQLTVKPDTHGQPALRFAGGAHVDRLHTVDNTLQEDLLNFRRLDLQKVAYSSAPAGFSIARVLVQEPYARVVISPQQIVNISAVFDPKGAAEQLAAWQAAQSGQAPVKESRAQRSERERAEQAQHKAQAAARAAALARPDAPESFPVRIGEVSVTGGRMNFSDLSIRPNFSAEIQDLGGTIKTLSSARATHAVVDLKGNLGEFSPVTIGGGIQPFAFDRFTDIGMKFENIALPVFNPYSGVFAGYNIAKGALTTELHYRIDNRQLNATHHIRIDQLEWGEPSEFKGEATLPVKFATALLRDRNGVINLDIPVTGSLDDPQLRIGPLVWQVIKNIIVKAATAPFALLGSLFAGAEDAQFIDFHPGSAALDPAVGEKLAALAKGLAEKPEISLDVPLAVAPDVDRPALAQQRFAQLLEVAARAAGGDTDTAPAYASFTPQQKRVALLAWLRAQQRPVPQIPAPPPPPQGATRAEVQELADQAAVSFLEQDLRANVVVADDDLERLAQARAAAVQAALLRSGELPAGRVFIVRNAHEQQLHDGLVRLQLDLR